MKRTALALFVALTLSLLLVPPAGAAFGFQDLDVSFTNEDGSMLTQAGAHPFAFTTSFRVNTTVNGEGKEVPDGETKNLVIGQLPGLAGDPTALPRCASSEFVELVSGAAQCPDSSAVGVASVRAGFEPPPAGGTESVHAPVYNLVPPPGAAAKLGFVILNVPVTVEVGLSEAPPYNIVAHINRIPQIVLFYSSKVTLWGNPADPAHDSLRGECVSIDLAEEPQSLGTCPVNIPARPFLTMPRSCKGPLGTTLAATAWGTPPAFSTDEATTPAMTGCNKLGFDATIDAKPTSAAAESPAGLDFILDLEDEGLGNPKGIANADLDKVEALLPEGVTANPSAAEGLGVCTLGQYESASLTVRGCPEASKLGSALVRTPLLEDPIEGALYLAEPDDTGSAGAENPFDSLIALYLMLRSPRYGIFVAQAGKVVPDPATGRLRTTFEDIPEVPVSEISLRFREGPRAPLVTPPLCGAHETTALLYPSSGAAPTEAKSSFTITSGPNGGPCPAGVPPFKPGFEAGSISNNAGSYSPFVMRLTRNDGEQDMTRFDSILPPGVTGRLAGVERCPDQAIAVAKAKTGREELAAPSCPSGSQIGSILAGAGVGPALTYVPGKVYLGGQVGSAPLSVIVITPAVAGPFDAGTVVVREALRLNPNTAEVEVDGAASDPIPHILKGIPLKLRDLRVFVDRDNFTLNPTSCNPSSARATLFGGFADVFSSADDVPAQLSTRYQAANCSRLGFKPHLGLKLSGGTRRGQYPALKATLTPRPGDANVGRAVVTLPPSAFVEQAHIGTVCTRVQYAVDQCPAASVYGKATAWTPLLDEPLSGPVYLRANGGERLLPDLVVSLHGTVDFDLVGYIDSKKGRLRSTFATPPDAPVSRFVLEMRGGKKGLVVNSRNLCAGKPQRAKSVLTGQNGKRSLTRPVVKASCKKRKRKAGGR